MKASAQLPPVDPDFRLVECRPEKLHACARGLLQHLRRIRAGSKAEGYPIATIKAAAVWLIESYAEAGIAPAPEAALLVSEIMAPKRDASTLPVRRSSEAAYLALRCTATTITITTLEADTPPPATLLSRCQPALGPTIHGSRWKSLVRRLTPESLSAGARTRTWDGRLAAPP